MVLRRRFGKVAWGSAALLGAAVLVSAPLAGGQNRALSARWAGYGSQALATGRVPVAVQAFQKALDLDGQDLAAWAGLADAYKREGRADQVLDAYARMIQAVPKARTAGAIVARGWRTPPPSGVAGYYLYVSETQEGGFRKVSPLWQAPSFRVEGLVPGLRYYFMVTTLDRATPPVESKPSAVWSMVCQSVVLPSVH